MKKLQVLITGAEGYLGSRLAQDFSDREFTIRLTDIAGGKEWGGGDKKYVAPMDLLHDDSASSDEALSGIDVVVHAATSRPDSDRTGAGTGAESRFSIELDNLRIAQSLMAKAMKAGVRRVVILSSNHATDWYETCDLLTEGRLSASVFPAAVDFYGWARSAIELLTIPYSVGTFGYKLEVVILRVGAPRELIAKDYLVFDAEGNLVAFDRARLHRDLGAFLSRRDFAQLVALAITSPQVRGLGDLPWLITYATSQNARAFWSLDTARLRLGYVPMDDSDSRFAGLIREAGLPPWTDGTKVLEEGGPAW